MKPQKQPRKYTYCENCDKPYGFINCPVVKGGQWWCIKCRIEEEKVVPLSTPLCTVTEKQGRLQ